MDKGEGHFAQDGADEADDRVPVGEDADHVVRRRSPCSAALVRVVRRDLSPEVSGKARQEDVRTGSVEVFGDLGQA